ncbi:hypothetical protein BKA64DRAFT_337252 [Cadophora sp. MPI-SDFR-AT-0126]|nr:hypothetical protein BKA64DRAFT_337252 [Leotiomycetes sp. MPI-SDFR-AT-0126]
MELSSNDAVKVPSPGDHVVSNRAPLLLECLGPEILIMIFEHICIAKPEILPNLRLLSRRVDQIIAPLSYRRIVLSVKKLSAVSGRSKREDTVRNVHAHMRHVELRHLLDWDDVASLLFGCAQLDTITWACGREILQCYFPDAMQRLVRDKWPKVHIFNEFLDYPGMRQSGSFLKTFPASNMISLTLHNRVFDQSNGPLHQFLTSCVNLKELRLYDLKSPFEPTAGRLPAVKTFFTDIQSWPYRSDNVRLLWDFSRLEEIDIRWHLFGLLSQSMLPEDFLHLRHLRTEYRWVGADSIVEYTQYHTTRTSFLNSILEQAPENQFQELDVKCHLSTFSITALTRHGRSLRIIKLLDVSGFEVDGSITPTTTVEDLTFLQSTCPSLTELAIGLNIDSAKKISTFVDILSRFRNVRIVTIYMQKPPKSYFSGANDQVLGFGQFFADQLQKHKTGLPLSSVSINIGEFTMMNTPHRRIQLSKVQIDMAEIYQPRRLLNFSWDGEGQILFEETVGRGR